MIVLEFRVDFVVRVVAELSEHELEVDAHVRVVVERHLLTFLDEEHD